LYKLVAGQPRPNVPVPTMLGSHAVTMSGAMSMAAATAAGTPMNTIRLTMPPQQRQRSPAAAAVSTPQQMPQVLKVVGTQPGSIPQIITLSSPRMVIQHVDSV